MCGITGIFNQEEAESKVAKALKILKNRGKDASRTMQIPGGVLGHTLHSIVGHVPQPIMGKGILTANCEIYNWQEINKIYDLSAENDAELLLKFLDKFKTTKINELDGVFAFAYYSDKKIILARDFLGVKPLWYVHNEDDFAFASEKKALESLGYIDIQELNPRNILTYDIETKKLISEQRDFFNYLPEHKNSYKKIKETTKSLLQEAIDKRIPKKKFGLLFSGGIDSTFLAKHFKDNNNEFTCYTAVLDSDTVIPSDLAAAQKVAKELNLNLKIKTIKQKDIPHYLKKIVPLIEDSNVVKVGVALTFYLACEMAREDGCKVIFSGLGSEEIFAGYDRHKKSANINQECVSGLLKMYERDLYRDDVLTMDNNLELRLPFLDHDLVNYALKIPTKHKIKDEITKYILRDIAFKDGIPKEFAFRKKTAAQYGSRLDNALGKLAKKNKFSSKSSYLRTFYPSHNLKLGVLFSSGKDSMSAAYIMQKQNYELSCLITMRSLNPDSYMFQTVGTELVKLQAEAMGLPLVEVETEGIKEEELKDLEKALLIAKEKYNIEGIVSGALFSTYQRDRIEKICDKLGLKIFSPLWHKSQEQHMKEVVNNGFEVIMLSISAEGLNKKWLNKKITNKEIKELVRLNEKIGINLAGEGGEFETFVLDGPLFKKKIVIKDFTILEEKEYIAKLIIKKAELMDK
jgi:diphthine-ammonia ligase